MIAGTIGFSSDEEAPTRPSVIVSLGKHCEPTEVTRGLDDRALGALSKALSRCRCDRCISLRGGAS